MPLTMPNSALAVIEIASFEGFRASPYRDTAGVATIGYGTTRYPNGIPVSMDDAPITQDVAHNMLLHDVARRAYLLWPSIKRQPTVNQWSAILSLAYNEGVVAISNSTVVRDFNAGAIDLAADAFLDWDKVHINGQLVTSDGLLNRRKAERSLFLTPDKP